MVFADYTEIILIYITFLPLTFFAIIDLYELKETKLIDFLNQTVLWWHWIVLGLFLLILEMNTGTFIILGLGLAAIVVGLLDTALEMSFTSEILTWTGLSIVSLWAWKKWAKVEHVSNSGQSNYNLDTLGTVMETIEPHSRGKVTFDTPILGNTSWTATANTNISKNSRVKIVEVHGQLIEVTNI